MISLVIFSINTDKKLSKLYHTKDKYKMVNTSTKYTIKKAKADLQIKLDHDPYYRYSSENPIKGTIRINTNQQFAAYGI